MILSNRRDCWLNWLFGGISIRITKQDRIEFLKRMHQMVMAKISLKEGRKIIIRACPQSA